MYVGYTFFAVNLDAWYFYLFLYINSSLNFPGPKRPWQ